MARGWESKSVEDQQAQAEAGRDRSHDPVPTPAERDRQARRMALNLSRSRILQDLQAACHPNHRAMLEKSLAFIDGELEALDGQ